MRLRPAFGNNDAAIHKKAPVSVKRINQCFLKRLLEKKVSCANGKMPDEKYDNIKRIKLPKPQ